jgi:Protein of unknown function (DUF4238)
MGGKRVGGAVREIEPRLWVDARAQDVETSSTMNDSQDNHYIPQFLLRGWCNENGKLTVYSRRQGRVVTSDLNPRSTGFETNLYRYNQGPLEKRHTIETDFMTPHIDTPAASIVKKILNREWHKLTRDERSRFAYFILSLLARHPDAVALAKANEAITSALARDPDEYEAVKGPASPPTLTEWTRQNAPSLIPNFGMSRIPSLITHDKPVEHIFRMPWWIHDVHHANTDLLLSDRPCLLKGNAVEGECLIALPLSPTMLFFICNIEHQIHVLRSMRPTSLVKLVNRASVLHAADRVYGIGKHHLPLVEKFLRSGEGPPR